MADNTVEAAKEALTQAITAYRATDGGWFQVVEARDALIAAVRAENAQRLAAIASVLQQHGDTTQSDATGQAFCAAAAYVRERSS